MPFGVFFLLISFLQFILVCWRCVFFFFPPWWSGDHITKSACSGTIEEQYSIFAHFIQVNDMPDNFFAEGSSPLVLTPHSTTIAVDSFRRDLWMFLYGAYFVWLPTKYFHCAVCARLCPGLACGWLWNECSPRLLGSRKPSTCRSSRVFKSVPLSLCRTGECRLGLVADAAEMPLPFDVSSFVPLSRWSSPCPRQCVATISSRTLYWRLKQVVFLAPQYALVVIRQNFAQFKKNSEKT